VEKHGLDSPPYEIFTGCPECGGDYAVAPLCDVCGEEIVDTYYHIENGMKICKECCIKVSLRE
jgi:formylmethanofuran dehydrogenase subunit E